MAAVGGGGVVEDVGAAAAKAKRFNKILVDPATGAELKWIKCGHGQCRRWHRELGTAVNEWLDSGKFTCPLARAEVDRTCREAYTAADGTSEDEYWEKHPDDLILSDADDQEQAKAREDLEEAEKTLAALKDISTLSSSALCVAFMGLPTGQKTFHHAVMVNAFFKAAQTLTDPQGIRLGEDDMKKTRTRASFKSSTADPGGATALKAYMTGIWDRAGDPQKLTIQNMLKTKLETYVKGLKDKIDGNKKDKAPAKGPSRSALLIRAFADPSNQAHVDKAQSKLPESQRPTAMLGNISEQSALHQFKDLLEAANAKKATYDRADLKEQLVGPDFYNFVKDLDPTTALFDMSDEQQQIKSCVEAKGLMTTICSRITVLQNKVEASGFAKKPTDPEYWQRAFERETDATKGTTDPIAAYGLFYCHDKNLKTFSGSLPPPYPAAGATGAGSSHGNNSIQRRYSDASSRDGSNTSGTSGSARKPSPSDAMFAMAQSVQAQAEGNMIMARATERTEKERAGVLNAQRLHMQLNMCHEILENETRLQAARKEGESIDDTRRRFKRKYEELSDAVLM